MRLPGFLERHSQGNSFYDEWGRFWRTDDRRRPDTNTALVTIAILAGVGLTVYLARERQKSVAAIRARPRDDAPEPNRKLAIREKSSTVVSNVVTINRSPHEVYDFYRDFSNLPSFMSNVKAVETRPGGRTSWTMKGPMGRTVQLETEFTEDTPGEVLAWRSVEGSDIRHTGRITFRKAPADRGTEVRAVISYDAPMGEIGRWVAKAFRREPEVQGRHELKRLKMLLETGEIATSANRRENA